MGSSDEAAPIGGWTSHSAVKVSLAGDVSERRGSNGQLIAEFVVAHSVTSVSCVGVQCNAKLGNIITAPYASERPADEQG